MSDIKDGGPAFPVAIWSNDQMRYVDTGATLRDYFAAHAPNPPEIWHGGDRNVSDVVDWAWHYADQMLKAREA